MPVSRNLSTFDGTPLAGLSARRGALPMLDKNTDKRGQTKMPLVGSNPRS